MARLSALSAGATNISVAAAAKPHRRETEKIKQKTKAQLKAKEERRATEEEHRATEEEGTADDAGDEDISYKPYKVKLSFAWRHFTTFEHVDPSRPKEKICTSFLLTNRLTQRLKK